jgi:exosome complex component RRP46
MTFSATVLAVNASGEITREPSVKDAAAATSLHALAFSSHGHLLLNESQGPFHFETWEKVHQRALAICHGTLARSSDGDVAMAEDVDGRPLEGTLRETVEDKFHQDYAWKIDAP